MDVGALAVAVEDRDELGRAVEGGEGVRGHRGELGRLAGLDRDDAVSEPETDATVGDEEPVVAGMYPGLGSTARRLQPHLHRDAAARRAAQQPRRALAGAAGRRTDHDVVVAADVEQFFEPHLEAGGQREEDVEADRAAPGLDAADRRGAEVGAFRQLVE